VEFGEVGSTCTSKEFGTECNDDNQNGVAPRNSAVECSKVGVETGQREVLKIDH
jgi:hypothetical protein